MTRSPGVRSNRPWSVINHNKCMNTVTILCALSALLLGAVPAAHAQAPSGGAGRQFLAGQGFGSPPALYAEALDTFLAVEAAYGSRDYARAGRLLDALWAAHPAGTREWASAYRQAWDIGRSQGINIGCPPCYYALRMLTECVRWRRSEAAGVKPTTTATLTVVLVGNTSGNEPATAAQLKQDQGARVTHKLEPLLRLQGNRVIHDSLRLFREYMQAASGGLLATKVRVLDLASLDVPVAVSESGGRRWAGLTGEAWEQIWRAVPAGVHATTDWWWVIYPSCIPEQYPDFAGAEFVTGGMGSGPDGISPCFIIDDRWLTRKPPHLGRGPYTTVERQAYLPQWLQHEFMHHLFRIYPQFGLEQKDHQWFDRKSWPAGFKGEIEPDYYAEALRNCFQKPADPPLHLALLYRPAPAALYSRLSLGDLVGAYRHDPVQNDWHQGRLTSETVDGKPGVRWTNRAGKTWTLRPDLAKGVLVTGPDCPYYDAATPGANLFRISLVKDGAGRWRPQVGGFVFNGGAYQREGR